MKFSLRTLMLLMTGLAVSLAIANYDHVIGGIVAVIAVIGAAVLAPKDTRRSIIWGAVLGMIALVVIVKLFASLTTGVWQAHNYDERNSLFAITEPWRPFFIPLGGFAGGVIGLALYHRSIQPRRPPRDEKWRTQ